MQPHKLSHIDVVLVSYLFVDQKGRTILERRNLYICVGCSMTIDMVELDKLIWNEILSSTNSYCANNGLVLLHLQVYFCCCFDCCWMFF